MRRDRLGIVLLLLTLDVPAAEAQEAVGSGSLSQVLRVGQTVKVYDVEGDATRGKVLVVTDDQVALAIRRPFRDSNEVFSADTIRAIDTIDSGWNGAVIGAFGGVGVLWWFVEHPLDPSNVLNAFLILPMPLYGALVGAGIDGFFNKRIWDRPTPTVTVAPVLGAQRLGLTARVRF
jgi:hypothetical protein